MEFGLTVVNGAKMIISKLPLVVMLVAMSEVKRKRALESRQLLVAA